MGERKGDGDCVVWCFYLFLFFKSLHMFPFQTIGDGLESTCSFYFLTLLNETQRLLLTFPGGIMKRVFFMLCKMGWQTMPNMLRSPWCPEGAYWGPLAGPGKGLRLHFLSVLMLEK